MSRATLEMHCLNEAGDILTFETEAAAKEWLAREVEHDLVLFILNARVGGKAAVECDCGWRKDLTYPPVAQEIAAAVGEHLENRRSP